MDVKIVDLSMSWEGAKNVRPNTLELWFGSSIFLHMCTESASGHATPAPQSPPRRADQKRIPASNPA